MSGKKEQGTWLFLKKAKTRSQESKVSDNTSTIASPKAKSTSSIEKKLHKNDQSGTINNNNWIVENWFKTWPTRDKLVLHESLTANLTDCEDLVKRNVISLDVIVGSDDKKFHILSWLRSKRKFPFPKMNGQDLMDGDTDDHSVSLDMMLESLPLVYNPSTKQLQVGKWRSQNLASVISQNSVNDVVDKERLFPEACQSSCEEKCQLLISQDTCKQTCAESPIFNKKILLSNNIKLQGSPLPPSDTALNECSSHFSRVSTNTSLSSFSSLASSNTDLSLHSASDSAVCLSGETSFSEATASKRKGGITNFFTRNLFSWKAKDNPIRRQEKNLAVEDSYPSNESLSSQNVHCTSNWKIFSRGATALSSMEETKANSCSMEAGTVGLIMEGRPSNLPAKTACEEERHKQEYENIVLAAKRKEVIEAKGRKKAEAVQRKLEQHLTSSVHTWNQVIIPKWESMHRQRKTRDLWWLGIPSCVREKVWKLAIGNELNIQTSLYSILVQRSMEKLVSLRVEGMVQVQKTASASADSDQEATIDLICLDVSRTFPHLCIFQKGGPFHDPLHNILGAYVCYRPDIGYVQGMSFLAATILLNMDECDAFVAFANLLNNPVHMAFYSVDQRVMRAYYKTLEALMVENLPSLGEHLSVLKVTPDLYFLDWILTIFSRSLPLDLSARIWDVYLRDGEEFLFRAALGILKYLEKDLRSQECVVMTAQLLTRLPDDVDHHGLFRAISSVQTTIGKRSFNQILQQYIKQCASLPL